MLPKCWQDLARPPLIPGGAFRRVRFHAALEALAPHPLPFCIKVTGTSGKGSACAMLEAALRASGKSVGAFTSPHLISPGERIRLDGRDTTEPELNDAIRALAPVFARLDARGESFRPSFFEALLLAALHLFRKHEVQISILEVAFGGREDPVGLIPGPLSILTTVGPDHLPELGPTLADVAAHKAGVATPGGTLILGPRVGTDLAHAITAAAPDVRIHQASRRVIDARSLGARGHDITIDTPDGPARFTLPLPGDFQVDNLACANAAIGALREIRIVRSATAIAGVEHTRWPGRLETLEGDPAWIIDCAHNELAFRALADFCRQSLTPSSTTLIFGATEQSKVEPGLALLSPLAGRTIYTEGFHRSVPMPRPRPGLRRAATPAAAVTLASAPGHTVIVAGSVFLAGACRAALLAPAGAHP